MKRRMTMLTATATLVLLGVGGCGTSDSGGSAPETPASTSASAADPSAEPSSDSPEIAGDWEDTKADWVVHFHDDGTFAEDFQGVTDFRVGTYTVEGDTVSLLGDDGNTDKGTIEGDTLAFKLGTLTRK